MYLESLKIINFRKFKNLEVKFNKGLNLIVGENDSGKTAIIDAIKYVLQTQSYEYIRPSYEDFHLEESKKEEERNTKFRIECIFSDFEDYEAKSFLEWLGIDDDKKYYLKIWYEATRKDTKVFYDIRAGADDEGTSISGEARDFLRTTYLKPLRDAERELTPKRGSRLSQILDSHEQFKNKDKHRLKWIMKLTNKAIEKYFTNYEGKDLLDDINKYLSNFTLQGNQLNSKFIVSENSLKSILEKLALKLFNHDISENNIQGLGSHNLLYISAELLLLKKLEYSGLKLAMIEEIEAHLHPQIQIRLIEAIQEIGEKNKIQFILSSHSPNLASKIKLKNLIVCKNGQTYPMGIEFTKLLQGDYYFLEKFLDSTKANLFFANAVILVEGVAENILIPTLAKIIGRDLSDHGVSIVNVGGVAFLRYANIFLRKEEPTFDLSVALITDVDVKPIEAKPTIKEGENKREMTITEIETKRTVTITAKEGKYPNPIKSFIAPYWTLEYSIALSCLSKLFNQAVYVSWKTKSKDYVYTAEKKISLIVEADIEYDSWLEEGKMIEQIAYLIYNDRLNKSTNKLSKAVVAQIFSQLLNEAKSLPCDLITDDKLKYLIDAINYVTGKK